MKTRLSLAHRLGGRFDAAIGNAYDMNDILAAFWLYVAPLAAAERHALSEQGSEETIGRAVSRLVSIDVQSYHRHGLFSQEIDELRTMSGELEYLELQRTAVALRLFCGVAESMASEPPEACWCEHKLELLECKQCGYVARYLFWTAINVKKRPELASAARAGRLRNEARCYACGASCASAGFFYCDPSRDEFLVVLAPGEEEEGAVKATVERCWQYLLAMPLEMRDGKDYIVYAKGWPVLVFEEDRVAAITVCRSHQEFEEVVRDQVLFNVEPFNVELRLTVHSTVEKAYSLSADEQWLPAAAAFARAFLEHPCSVSFLVHMASCLRNAERNDDAGAVERDAARLLVHLKRHGIVRRMVRMRVGRAAHGEDLLARILREGLPKEWGFGDLLARLWRYTGEASS